MFRIPILVCLLAWLCLAGQVRADAGSSGPPVPSPPRRIISMAPNITETIFALGAGDRLVGVTDFCNYPPEARSIRRAGGWSNPNFEVLTALKPDLIIYQGRHEKVREFTMRRGLPAANVDMDTSDSIRAGIIQLGTLLGTEDQATSLTAAMDAQINQLRARVADIPAAQRPRVFLSLSRQPGAMESLFTVSDASFIAQALKLAGGINVFADAGQTYAQAAKEALLAAQPQVVIELVGTNGLQAADRQRLVQDWNAFPSLPAVRDGRIAVIAGEYAMIPGPRFAQLAQALQTALYPDLK